MFVKVNVDIISEFSVGKLQKQFNCIVHFIDVGVDRKRNASKIQHCRPKYDRNRTSGLDIYKRKSEFYSLI